MFLYANMSKDLKDLKHVLSEEGGKGCYYLAGIL